MVAQLSECGADEAALVGRLIGFDYSANANTTGIEGDGRQTRDRAFRVMAQYLRSLNKDRGAPVILLLDDLHWADDGSLDFINHIASACQDTPILLLCLPGWRSLSGGLCGAAAETTTSESIWRHCRDAAVAI